MYAIPQCYSCKNFIRAPQRIGGKAKCSMYAKIPDNIYFHAENCKTYIKKDVIEMTKYDAPKTYANDNRNVIDPAIVSQKLLAENLTMRETITRINEIYETHSDIIGKLYGNIDDYTKLIIDCMLYPKDLQEVDKA